jgi:heme-degrading monooxygenase HmoA
MYLRVTAFKSDPAKLEDGIAFLKNKIIPAMSKVPGYLGATCVVDREKGEGAASTMWESLEAMNNAEQLGQQSRSQSSEATGIEVLDVDRFEVTALETATPTPQLPSYTRITSAYGDPSKTDKVAQMIRDAIPKVKGQPGFRAYVAGVNRATGRGFTASSWATPEDRESSNTHLAGLRQPVVEEGAMYGLQIQNVETVVVEIKVPVKA